MEGAAKEAFRAFVECNTGADALAHFALFGARFASYEALRDAVKPTAVFRHRTIFDLLDARMERCAELRKGASNEKRLVVIGAGPCGLRAAVEARLVGMRVSVFEMRSDCSRHNILKTWKSTFEDAHSLGALVYTPVLTRHGATLHAGTRELQLCYLKSALLLGARVEFEVAVRQIVRLPAPEGAHGVWLCSQREAKAFWGRAADEEAGPEELALRPNTAKADSQSSLVDYRETAQSRDGAVCDFPADENVRVVPFDALLDAAGESSPFSRNLGFDRKLTKYGPAVGVVVNALISGAASAAEKKLPEFVVSRNMAQWSETAIGKLSFEIENMEYMRGSTHFVVATIPGETEWKRFC